MSHQQKGSDHETLGHCTPTILQCCRILDFMFQWQQSDHFPFCFIKNCAAEWNWIASFYWPPSFWIYKGDRSDSTIHLDSVSFYSIPRSHCFCNTSVPHLCRFSEVKALHNHYRIINPLFLYKRGIFLETNFNKRCSKTDASLHLCH